MLPGFPFPRPASDCYDRAPLEHFFFPFFWGGVLQSGERITSEVCREVELYFVSSSDLFFLLLAFPGIFLPLADARARWHLPSVA